jgi:hypothetical protein
MQEHLTVNDDPLYISNSAFVSAIQEKSPSGGAQPGSSRSLSTPELLNAVCDTFSNTSVRRTAADISHDPRRCPPVSPSSGAQRWELLEYIKQQLDCYGKEPLLMDRYQLLGPDNRKIGGESPC